MRIGLYFLVLVFFSEILFAKTQTVELALSFDDAPGFDTPYFKSENRADKLLEILKRRKIKGAIFFINICNHQDVTRSIEITRKYLKAGHFIGNHTCMHYSYQEVSYDKFVDDVLLNQKYMNRAGFVSKDKYFRFPFFHEGQSVQKRDKIHHWLKQQNYTNVPATIYTDDYKYDEKINKKLNKKDQLKVEQELMLKSINEQIDLSLELSQKLFNRQVKHNIILHELDLTVDSLDRIIDLIVAKNIKIVPFDKIITDPIYNLKTTSTQTKQGLLQQLKYEKNN